MKILLVSDTHTGQKELKNVTLPRHKNEVQMAIHLGDFARDLIDLQPSFPNIKMVGVGGAGEFFGKQEDILEIGDGEIKRRILIMHGHTKAVKTSLNRLIHYAREKEVHACFFGHTHKPLILEEHGIFFMNPGSLTFALNGQGSYGIVTISPDGKFHGEVLES